MKLYSISSKRKKAPGSSPSSDQIDHPHQGSESQSAINSKAARARLSSSRVTQAGIIRTLTELVALAAFPRFMFASRSMLELLVTIHLARDSRAPVLFTGETGTGKELFARAAHLLSTRKERKFITVNCAAMPTDLVESMLFGHIKGAFTGAVESKIGYCEAADSGTLFLDEIGELPLNVQPKLLRFLQEGEVHPVGAVEPVKIDVRVIAVTNRNLEEEVRAGRFRADLFERLNVLRLHIPPLRERREEIPCLIAHFLERYQEQAHREGLKLSGEVIRALLDYDWPRNVRQLANEIYRLVLQGRDNEVISPERLSPDIRGGICSQSAPAVAIVGGKIVIDLNLPYPEMKDQMERLAVINALKETSGNVKQAAARLQMSRFGLIRAIERLGIEVKSKDIRKVRE